MSNTRRIAKDLQKLIQEPPEGVRLISQKTITEWETEIDGPLDTIWEGGKFRLSVVFPPDYPFKAPTVKFITPIYHPNVALNGNICLDLLIDKWLPSFSVTSLLISIRSFLDDPNPDHGLNDDALQTFRTDRSKYEARVKQFIRDHMPQ